MLNTELKNTHSLQTAKLDSFNKQAPKAARPKRNNACLVITFSIYYVCIIIFRIQREEEEALSDFCFLSD